MFTFLQPKTELLISVKRINFQNDIKLYFSVPLVIYLYENVPYTVQLRPPRHFIIPFLMNALTRLFKLKWHGLMLQSN